MSVDENPAWALFRIKRLALARLFNINVATAIFLECMKRHSVEEKRYIEDQ